MQLKITVFEWKKALQSSDNNTKEYFERKEVEAIDFLFAI